MGTNPGYTELMEKRKEADDVYDYSYALRNSLKRLGESKILSEGDKDIIREFLEHLRAKRVSTGRLAKYGFTIRRLTEHLRVPIRDAGRKDIERLSIWVQEQGYSPHTIQDSLFAISSHAAPVLRCLPLGPAPSKYGPRRAANLAHQPPLNR